MDVTMAIINGSPQTLVFVKAEVTADGAISHLYERVIEGADGQFHRLGKYHRMGVIYPGDAVPEGAGGLVRDLVAAAHTKDRVRERKAFLKRREAEERMAEKKPGTRPG